MTSRERKIQEGKTFIEHHNTQKWANEQRSPTSRSPWCIPTKKWMTNNYPKKKCWLKKKELIRHKMTKQKGKHKKINLLLCKVPKIWFSERWC
jgi:hypothetical protein